VPGQPRIIPKKNKKLKEEHEKTEKKKLGFFFV